MMAQKKETCCCKQMKTDSIALLEELKRCVQVDFEGYIIEAIRENSDYPTDASKGINALFVEKLNHVKYYVNALNVCVRKSCHPKPPSVTNTSDSKNDASNSTIEDLPTVTDTNIISQDNIPLTNLLEPLPPTVVEIPQLPIFLTKKVTKEEWEIVHNTRREKKKAKKRKEAKERKKKLKENNNVNTRAATAESIVVTVTPNVQPLERTLVKPVPVRTVVAISSTPSPTIAPDTPAVIPKSSNAYVKTVKGETKWKNKKEKKEEISRHVVPVQTRIVDTDAVNAKKQKPHKQRQSFMQKMLESMETMNQKMIESMGTMNQRLNAVEKYRKDRGGGGGQTEDESADGSTNSVRSTKSTNSRYIPSCALAVTTRSLSNASSQPVVDPIHQILASSARIDMSNWTSRVVDEMFDECRSMQDTNIGNMIRQVASTVGGSGAHDYYGNHMKLVDKRYAQWITEQYHRNPGRSRPRSRQLAIGDVKGDGSCCLYAFLVALNNARAGHQDLTKILHPSVEEGTLLASTLLDYVRENRDILEEALSDVDGEVNDLIVSLGKCASRDSPRDLPYALTYCILSIYFNVSITVFDGSYKGAHTMSFGDPTLRLYILVSRDPAAENRSPVSHLCPLVLTPARPTDVIDPHTNICTFDEHQWQHLWTDQYPQCAILGPFHERLRANIPKTSNMPQGAGNRTATQRSNSTHATPSSNSRSTNSRSTTQKRSATPVRNTQNANISSTLTSTVSLNDILTDIETTAALLKVTDNSSIRETLVINSAHCIRNVYSISDRRAIAQFLSDSLKLSTPEKSDPSPNHIAGSHGCNINVINANSLLIAVLPTLISDTSPSTAIKLLYSNVVTARSHIIKATTATRPAKSSTRSSQVSTNPLTAELAIQECVNTKVRRACILYDKGEMSRSYQQLTRAAEEATSEPLPSPTDDIENTVETINRLHPHPLVPQGYPDNALDTRLDDDEQGEERCMKDFLRMSTERTRTLIPDNLITDEIIIQSALKTKKGAAPGPFGDSGDIFRSVLTLSKDDADDYDLRSRFCDYIRALVRGELPMQAYQLLQDCSLILIPKKDNGIRPIAMGHFLLKVASRTINTIMLSQIRAVFPAQVGAGSISAGCDTVIHAHHLCMQNSPHLVHFQLDLRNAFNTLPRHLIFKAILRMCPALGPLVSRILGTESNLWILAFLALSRDAEGNNSAPSHIQSRTGTRQGDALSPTLFALGFHEPLLDALNFILTNSAKVPINTINGDAINGDAINGDAINGDSIASAVEGFVMGYLDDISGAISVDLLIEFLEYISRRFKEVFNITLNLSKCIAFFLQRPSELLIKKLEDMEVKVTFDGIISLGSPVGTNAFMISCLKDYVQKIRVEAVALTCFARANPHDHRDNLAVVAHKFHVHCLSTKLRHLLRTVPSNICMEYLAKPCDQLAIDTMLAIMRREILPINAPYTVNFGNVQSLHEALLTAFVLPVDKGGLGIPSMVQSVHAARIASLATCIPHLDTYQKKYNFSVGLTFDRLDPGNCPNAYVNTLLGKEKFPSLWSSLLPSTQELPPILKRDILSLFTDPKDIQRQLSIVAAEGAHRWLLEHLANGIVNHEPHLNDAKVIRERGDLSYRHAAIRITLNCDRSSSSFLQNYGSMNSYQTRHLRWVPSSEQSMSSKEFSLACCLRMGVPMPAVAAPALGVSADSIHECAGITAPCASTCASTAVPWSSSCLHGLACTLHKAFTLRHDDLCNFIVAQCKRSGMATSTLDVDSEAKIFGTHTEGEHNGNRNRQRMDIVVRSWTWELHRNAGLPVPTGFRKAKGPVTLLIDVFFSDAMSHLTDVTVKDLTNAEVVNSLCSANPICDVDGACDKRSHNIKHSKYDKPIAQINAACRHSDTPPMVLLPLNFDVLGHASRQARDFLNALFRLEVHRSNTIMNLSLSIHADDYDTRARTMSAAQIHSDNVITKRWREVSTLINKSTTLHIIRNASSVSYSLAAKAANAVRFTSQQPNATVTIEDDDHDDDHISLSGSSTASFNLSAVSGAVDDINLNSSQVDHNPLLAAGSGMVGGDDSP